MTRERALKIVLVIVGLFFTAVAYPALGGLHNPANSDTGDTMLMAIYAALGVFLLLAARNPRAHRSLIGFAAWSSFAHAFVMGALGLETPGMRDGSLIIASAVLVVIGVVLLALLPAKQTAERPAGAAA